MPLREAYLCGVPFSVADVLLSEDEESRRKLAFVDDFKLQCPCTGNLTGSRLTTKLLPHASGVTLQFWLAETPQMQIAMSPPSSADKGVLTNDCFTNDATMAMRELAASAALMERAISPVRSGDEVRASTLQGAQVRQIRKRARSRRGILIPTRSGKGVLFSPKPPKVFPFGVSIFVKAKISALFPDSVELLDGSFQEPIHADLVGLTLPGRMLMSRPTGEKFSKSAVVLTSAMDAGLNMTFEVAVCFDWADAKPESLELIRIVRQRKGRRKETA